MTTLKDVLLHVNGELMSRIARYDALGTHRGERGERRENAFAEILSEFLPEKFSVASGEIVSAHGTTSKQVDVLIFDRFHSPLLCDARDSKIVPAESVYAAIEVKPNLASRAQLHIGLDNIRSVKELPRDAILPSHGGHRGPKANENPYGAIVTYGEAWDGKRIGDEMASYCSGWDRLYWPDAVCVCGSSVVLYATKEPDGTKYARPFWTKNGIVPQLALWPDGEFSLGAFLLEMLYHLGQMDLFPPDFQRYLRAARQA